MTAVGYVGGDPRKVDVDGYTQGDVLAANATGTLVPVAIGTAAQVLTTDAGEATLVDWENAGGGGGSTIVMRQARVTSGNLAYPNTGGAWQAVAGFELQIPAADGDYVDITASFFVESNDNSFLDIGVMVGSSIVRTISTDLAPNNTLEGEPGWYPPIAYRGHPGPKGFFVTPADLDGGNIRWVLLTKSAGGGVIFASPGGQFYWRSMNFGVVS